MQRYSCNVRPGGDLIHDVPKTGVSAAEVMILNHIHGEGAVVNIQPEKMDRTPSKVEYKKLVETYGDRPVIEVFGSGYNVQLPSKLELDSEEEEFEEEEASALDEGALDV